MANVKNLSLAQIKKADAAKYKDKKQVLLDDGKSKVDVDVVFRSSKKNKLLTELTRLTQEKIESKEEFEATNIFPVALSLIVKHFSSIDVKNLNTFDDHLEMYLLLNDNDYLKPILQAFDSNEVDAVIADVEKLMSDWVEEIDKQMSQITDNVKTNE